MEQSEILNVRLSDNGSAVLLLDQTLLPNEVVYLELKEAADCYEAIFHLRVRGAPAIGIFAGYAFYVLAKQSYATTYDKLHEEMLAQAAYLNQSRPTAVNLSWALKRMMRVLEDCSQLELPEILERLHQECLAIHREDMEMCEQISRFGLSLLKSGDGVLTHCNAGPLATSRYGTAIGPMLLGKELGIDYKVFVDETRPLLQGARLTAFELHNAGVDTTLICDNMASMVMSKGWVQACFVGCDRIAANGDFANKIGTSGVAILAKHYGIPFYALAPTSTIDMDCPTGADIDIELRDPEEIKTKFYEKPMAPLGVSCFNPAFDVTSHELVTGIITEQGISYPPYNVSLAGLFGQGK